MNELRTRIGIDTDQAQQDYESLVHSLSSMSVEEYEKQAAAQLRVMEQIDSRVKDTTREEREEVARNFALRKQGYDEEMRALKERGDALSQEHYDSLQRLQELKGVRESTGGVRGEEEIVLEERVNDLVSQRKGIFLEMNDLEAKAVEDKIATYDELAKKIRDTSGEEGGFGSVLGAGKQASDAINTAGASLQRALGPLFRILGPVGIAFSLEQVVEKLFKANEELRQIRANYADVAASMGDYTAGVGSLGGAQLELYQREIMSRYGDAIDKRMVPQVAAALYPGGFGEESMVGMTDFSLFMGMGSGVNPTEIATTAARLRRTLGISEEQIKSEIALLVDSAHELRIPFQDLAKWTTSLQEQTKLYGFELEDNRRLVGAFAHELDQGVIKLEDLVRVQTTLAGADESRALGVVAFRDQISKYMPGLNETLSGVGDTREQALYIRSMLQGRLPQETLRGLSDDQRALYGRSFDLTTGEATDTGFRSRLMQAVVQTARGFGAEAGGGALGSTQMMYEFLDSILGTNLSTRPIESSDAILRALESGIPLTDETIGRLSGSGPTGDGEPSKDAKAIISELTSIGEEITKNRMSLGSGVKSGVDEWWRDSSENIVLSFSRFFGGDMADVAAWRRTPEGQASYGVFARSIPGFSMTDGGPLGYEQLIRGLRASAGVTGGDPGRRRGAMEDLLQLLIGEGRIDGIDPRDAADEARYLMGQYYNTGTREVPLPASEQPMRFFKAGAATDLMFPDVRTTTQRLPSVGVMAAVERASRGQDASGAPGVQINVEGRTFTISDSLEELRRQLDEDRDRTMQEIYDALRDAGITDY